MVCLAKDHNVTTVQYWDWTDGFLVPRPSAWPWGYIFSHINQFWQTNRQTCRQIARLTDRQTDILSCQSMKPLSFFSSSHHSPDQWMMFCIGSSFLYWWWECMVWPSFPLLSCPISPPLIALEDRTESLFASYSSLLTLLFLTPSLLLPHDFSILTFKG